jgi:hypothetical protein
VIAQSFLVSSTVFIPFQKVTTSTDGAENAFMLLLAYFFILSGWINYYKAITITPHKEEEQGNETRLGTARFCVDLLIIFLYNNLVTLIPNKIHHASIFMYILPFIFICFLAWDILRFIEYRKSGHVSESKGQGHPEWA